MPLGRMLVGDAVECLRRLPAKSVDCVITSPPYFALRNYQVDGQIGLEANVDGWVVNLMAVAEEIARVLKDEGVFWLNLGDSYARKREHGAPPKSLVLAPERLLLALADHGWLIRNKVVWTKRNPMPSSVRDRLTCTWEPLYMLTRSGHYYFDLDAIRVPHTSLRKPTKTKISGRRPEWAGPLAGDQSGLDRLKAAGLPGHPLGKNPGDSWMIPTSNFRGGHHATFPGALVRRPLLATCPERVCLTCGCAWRRQAVARDLGRVALLGALRPSCECGAEWQPGVVLDPFFGSGTVGVVAKKMGRSWIGVELNPEFAAMAGRRIADETESAEALQHKQPKRKEVR